MTLPAIGQLRVTAAGGFKLGQAKNPELVLAILNLNRNHPLWITDCFGNKLQVNPDDTTELFRNAEVMSVELELLHARLAR